MLARRHFDGFEAENLTTIWQRILVLAAANRVTLLRSILNDLRNFCVAVKKASLSRKMLP